MLQYFHKAYLLSKINNNYCNFSSENCHSTAVNIIVFCIGVLGNVELYAKELFVALHDRVDKATIHVTVISGESLFLKNNHCYTCADVNSPKACGKNNTGQPCSGVRVGLVEN